MTALIPSNKRERPRSRAERFCEDYELGLPTLPTLMAGACPPGLSVAVADAGGMGAMGSLTTTPEGIREWVAEFRAASQDAFQLNTWVPDPTPLLRLTSRCRTARPSGRASCG